VTTCPSCGAAAGSGARFCPACGKPLPSDPDATVPTPVSSAGEDASSRPSSPSSSSFPSSDGTYPPGTLIANRYRIVGLLGRGGMGEVYRADDLTLGQSVALKFLPDAVSGSVDRRARFTNEVRTAREVAHPNVCRVYDIGEVDGRVYLSMEYIDGEDLSSLLRRIGRLPQEKAIEIARQLCAGVGALHDRHVLHRDLKPANVMIDGRGRVRITDFGLSGMATEIVGPEARAGTPMYMAPEQYSGQRADERSDLYALGLVLYEVFTGKRAFEADTPEEMTRRRESSPASPSSLLPDLDPAIERVVMRCLQVDPARRPSSAFAVAAALPGGDPLAEALAAGEVPSIEMVAAAGKTGRVRPLVGVACLLAAAAGLVLYSTVGVRRSLHAWEPMPRAPLLLEDRAREVLAAAGWTEAPGDETHGFLADTSVLRWIAAEDSTAGRWRRLGDRRPGAMVFWYRRSPEHLRPWNPDVLRSYTDPPQTLSGMVRVQLDPQGRLLSLAGVPPQQESAPGQGETAPPADWSAIIAAAGLDPAQLAPAEPEWVPESFADERRAWKGPLPDDPGTEIRLEAAAYRGRIVEFDLIGPWTRAGRMPAGPTGTAEFAIEAVLVFLIMAVFTAVVVLAVRHLRSGRGDQRGALRLSIIVFLISIAGWFVGSNHGGGPSDEVNTFFSYAAMSLLASGLFWSSYLALEPFVRSTWPGRIVSWSRLLTGRWRDPLIGRDVLAGAVFFLVATVMDCGRFWVADALHVPGPRPRLDDGAAFLGAGSVLSVLLRLALNAAFNAMFFFLLLLLLRMIFRRTPVAVAVYVVVFAASSYLTATSGEKAAGAALGVVAATVWLTVLLRFGLLAFVVGFLFRQIVRTFPMTLDTSAWYAGTSYFAMAIVLGLTLFGLWTATAGRSATADLYDD